MFPSSLLTRITVDLKVKAGPSFVCGQQIDRHIARFRSGRHCRLRNIYNVSRRTQLQCNFSATSSEYSVRNRFLARLFICVYWTFRVNIECACAGMRWKWWAEFRRTVYIRRTGIHPDLTERGTWCNRWTSLEGSTLLLGLYWERRQNTESP